MASSIKKGLDKTYHAAAEMQIELDDLQLMIFSDHHRGGKDAADDFEQCENIYRIALDHYYYHEDRYRLVLLGDVEELWERSPEVVMRTYNPVMQLESRFYAEDRYLRFVGNHDDNWYSPSAVQEYFRTDYDDLAVYDALQLKVIDQGQPLGTILFLHGHQGTILSDRFGRMSRWFVRHVWRPIQRLFNRKSTTPSQDWKLRSDHDKAMYNWAVEQQDLILIAGHTHRTVFIPGEPPEHTVSEIQKLQAQSGEDEPQQEIQDKRAFLNAAQQPCYFNTGCCSYSDGTITGIEISQGEMRLVRWPHSDGGHRPEVLATASLRNVFQQVQNVGAQMAP